MANLYLKCDALEGNSLSAKYKAWSEVESVQWSLDGPDWLEKNKRTSSNRQCKFGNLVVSKLPDGVSRALAEKCAVGASFEKVQLHVCDGAGNPVAKYILETAFVDKINLAAASGNSPLLEAIEFSYDVIEWVYVLPNNAEDAKKYDRNEKAFK